MRKFLKTVIIFSLTLLLIAPLAAIFMLSKAEIKQYEPVAVPPLLVKSYGEICSVQRMDINEMITVSGLFVSSKKLFMELPGINIDDIRMLVDPGDEIYDDQIIGYTDDMKNEIRATASGIILNIVFGSISYITLASIDEVALNCYVDDEILKVLKRYDVRLTTPAGDDVRILAISKISSENGMTSVNLLVPDGVYGKKVNNLKLYTGRVFANALIVDSRCLFHIDNDDRAWYVRTVDANGNFIDFVRVEVGYRNDDYATISGIPEGTLCDSGYGKIMGENAWTNY